MAGILYPEQEPGVLAPATVNPLLLRQVQAQRAANPRPNVTDIFGYGPDLNSYASNLSRNFAGQFEGLGTPQNFMGPFGFGGITAFHGSPHRFDKFDMSKVGTGEGAQAYGHGLYFAENPNVAKGYREGLSGKYSVEGLPPIPRQASGHKAMDFKSDIEQLMGVSSVSPQSDMIPFLRTRLEQRVNNWKEESKNYQGGSAVDDMNALVGWYEGHLKPRVADLGPQTVKPGGALYKVDIPDDQVAKMLDWDKPLSQQPESVKKAVAGRLAGARVEKSKTVTGYDLMDANGKWILTRPHPFAADDLDGATVYKVLVGGATPAESSARLLEAGIPGIKYLDQGSRSGGGKGTSNFVVFDDQIPKIIGRE
jgi:hypothetical protein